MTQPESPIRKTIEILLVDDSATDRMLAAEALKTGGMVNALHTVEDGEEAMQFLRREGKYRDAPRPDLILLDLNMPRKDGREVLAEVKQDPYLKYIPVVILTTSKADEDVLAAYGLHANCYITKPLDFAQFGKVASSLENFWFQMVTLPPEESLEALKHARPVKEEPSSVAPVHLQDKVWRVLIVEDSATDALLISAALEESNSMKFSSVRVDRVESAEARLRMESFDVIVSDLGLPDSQGMETVSRMCRAASGVPLIVLTMTDDDALGLQILQVGAVDYIVKGQISTRALSRAIRYAIDRRNIEEQLRHSQRMESIGVLAGGVAHDFNNMLTIIRGNAELQMIGGLGAAQIRSAAEQVLLASDRAATLTRQLLTFSRRQSLKLEQVDLNEVVGDFTKMLRRLLGPTIQLELHLAAHPLPIHADAGMIEQIIMNLAVNARDAMPSGGVLNVQTFAVKIVSGGKSTIPPAGPGDYVRLVVKDAGAGIPADILPHIFEPFYTTKQVGEGTGLGLSTVFGIVQQHRGLIEVVSEPGRGTTFTISLPLGVTGDAVTQQETPRPVELKKGGGETILLVDDEELVRDLAAMILRMNGYKVIEVRTGSEALLRWPEIGDNVDLVLTDMVMPDGVSGQELCRRLHEQNPDIRVAYCTGYSSGVRVKELRLTEGVNYLTKPYSVEALLGLVRTRLESTDSRPPIAT